MNSLFSWPKPESNLSTIIDADGRVVQVESRDDEEQKIKLQEIIDLLVAAGYFRARIKGLSEFDKVVGGLTWCIETCNFDVDIDLLFNENLTIGQKISLTEKLVAILPQMKCPHRIEPHQIQGLDFIHIFPVIQWLVKKSLETREERSASIRAFSINQFQKFYSSPENKTIKDQQSNLKNNLLHLKETYGPERIYRRKDVPPQYEELRVESTLLEYGYRSISLISHLNKDDATQDESQSSTETQKLEEEEQRINKLMMGMTSTAELEGRLTAGIVGNIVNLQSQEIAKAAKEYSDLQNQEESEGGPLSFARALKSLQRQKIAYEEKSSHLKKEISDLETKINKRNEKLKAFMKNHDQDDQNSSSLEEVENDNNGLYKKLESLVILNENLKQQEIQFKDQCKLELEHLQKLIKDTEMHSSINESNEKTLQNLEEERESVQKLRIQLAKKNRAIASLQRQLDQVPGRAELAQYQRRFLELYNQVAAKHKETKQFYTLYNTLDDTKLYLGKQLSLLNSILDNYQEAMSSASSRDQFMQQFDAIIEGIKQNKAKVERKHSEERQTRNHFSARLLSLVEQQRRYVTAVRELSIECRRNESLLSQFNQLKAAS